MCVFKGVPPYKISVLPLYWLQEIMKYKVDVLARE